MRESQADRTLRVVWIPGKYNLVDLLKNTIMKGNTRNGMVELILYNKSALKRERIKLSGKSQIKM